MPKKKRKSGTTTKIIRVPSAKAASPIIRVQAPRAAPVKPKRKSGRRRSSSGFGVGGYSRPIGLAVGGLAYGFAVKQGLVQKLPEIPVIGRTGAAAILLHELAKRGMGGEIVRNAATAAAVLTGYQLGLEGHVTGGEDGGGYEGGYDGFYTGDDSDGGDDVDASDDFADDSDLDDVEDQG